jgi:hypothetical protein
LGDQYVDFDQRHAAGVVGSEGAVALPFGREFGEEILRQARVVGLAPALGGEVGGEDFSPERGVVGGEAVQSCNEAASAATLQYGSLEIVES